MHKPYKKITAQLLLFSFLLESCYNPNIGIGKKALPTPGPADKQGQYAGEPHDKYPPKPPSHTWTTADKHPITFTFHNGQWQAAIKEHAAHGFWQHRQVPVVFEPGLTIEDVVDSNPTQQKQLLHLCPSQEEPDQPGYVYVGRGPSQAKPQPQLLSRPAARQTTPRNEVGLAQQQATTQQQPKQPSRSAIHSKHQQAKQPQQGETSLQQAQEQPGPQAVLTLPSPVQQIGEGPKSQDQLPTTPARATSKPLPAPSSASPRQGVAKKQPTSPQRAPSRRALSWRNQHELLHSQRAAQAKRAQSAAMAEPGNQLAQPAAPSQAIVSLTPAHPPSLAHKALQGIASQNLLAQGGHPVRFMHHDGQWWASVRERIGVFSRVWVLPVACERHGDIAKALAALQAKPTQYTRSRIHVMHTKQIPYVPQFVYLGAQGLRGGGNGADEPSGSGEPQGEPATGGQEGAAGSEPSQPLAAPQGHEASMRALHERMAQEDIKSTAALVKALNDAQTPEEQQALQQWIRKYIAWFNEQAVGNLTQQQGITTHEYNLLARIRPDNTEKRQLLRDHFNSLCNKIKEDSFGEEPLLEALEYTLQNMDSDVFGEDPSTLIDLGKDLLKKIKATAVFSKNTYSTRRSLLYSLHQVLVLIQLIAPNQWDEGIYTLFKKQIEAIADNAQYYPFRYHALLLAQILERLKSEEYRARLKRMRIVDGLRAGLAIGQVVFSVAILRPDTDAFQKAIASLQAAFQREGIEKKTFRNWCQDLSKCISALEDIQSEIKDFLGDCQSLKDAFASENMEAKTWYDWHQALKYASILSLRDTSEYSVFNQGLEALLQKAKLKNDEEGRKALGFGIVQQLRLLALHGPSGEVRKQSIQWLEFLSNPKAWGGDPEVMYSLLDGLGELAVYSQGAEQEQAEKALKSLTDSPPTAEGPRFLGRLPSGNFFSWGPEVPTALGELAAKKALQAWLGGQELADKLSAIPARAVVPASGGLFCRIHSLLSAEAPVASQSPAAAQEARQELRKYYQHQDFAQVKSLFEEEKPKHVDSLECQLMLIEQGKKQAAREGQQDDLSTHHEQRDRDKTPIALEDLFKNRSTKPDEPARAIHKVLLVGEPGTGKTTLSRKLAYRWAQGAWDQTFQAVYVLPVRELQKERYDARGESLVTAIANNCFHPMEEDEEYKRLCQQIKEELKQPTTLVVLDGLDERYGASEALLSQAKAGRHKLLLLSRPYGIEQERTMVDIEIAHAGFSDGQMQDYVRDNLSRDNSSPELGEALLQFIKEYPAIASIAHVPVNLQILCFLWRDNQAGVRKAAGNGSLPGLYRRLTRYIWKRYTEKYKEHNLQNKDREGLFDTLGEIALKALEQGEVLISQVLVDEVLGEDKCHIAKEVVKDAGFLLLEEVGSQYQFPHLTFQEYFAGRWLARQLLSGNAEEQEEVQDFLTKHQYAPQYGRMLSFLAGEVSKAEGVEGISKLLHMLNEGPQEVVGVQHMLLQMRLLNEWLCVAGEDLEEDLAGLEEDFHVMASLEEWFCEGLYRVRRKDNNTKLLELLTRGLQGSRAVAGQAEKVLPPLLEALRDQNDPSGSVRRAASEALGKVVEAAPGQAEKVLPPLLEALRDQNDPSGSVRRAASYALGKVVEAAPGQAEKVLPPLLEALKNDPSGYVRSAASYALGKVVEAAPGQAEKVLPPLLEALRDQNDPYGYVRSAASSALGKVVEAAPAEKVLPPLLEALRDQNDPSGSVRSAASEALGKVVEAAPGQAEKVLPPLLEALKNDPDGSVRIAASYALGKVVEAAPGQAEKVLPPLLEALRDQNDPSGSVRRAASYALGKVVEAAPGQAEKVLPPLLEALKNDPSGYVRSAASSALGKVVEAAPAEKVLPPLLEALRDQNDPSGYVRSAASYALGKVVEAAPGQAEKVLPPLLEALRDQNDPSGSVRIAASYALGKVVEAAPGQAEKVLPPLLEALRDQNDPSGYVRSAASYALGKVVEAAPGQAEKVLPPLLEALRDQNDPSGSVRRAASEALGKVVEAAPGQAEKVLPPLLEALRDQNDPSGSVRRAASEALGKVVEAAPGQAEKVLPPLLEALKNDPDGSVRIAASYALGKVVEAAPGQAEKVLPPLLEALRDQNDPYGYVRRAASYALGQVVQAAPDLAAQVLEPLQEAIRDDNNPYGYVRSAASEALGQVVQAAPAEQVLPPLLEALRDQNDPSGYVRSAASEALGKVVEAAPGQAEKVLPPLLEALRDQNDPYGSVRRAASEALGKVSLQQFIDIYWDTQNQELKQGLIPLIATQLYHTPLVVQTIRNSQDQRLVLYPSAGEERVEWKKTHEEVQRFVQQIKSAAKQKQ